MRLKYNPETQVLRLQHPDWREALENVAEVVLGDIIFYVQIYSYNIRSKVALLHSEDLDPETNQEIAFLVKFLRDQHPILAIDGRRFVPQKQIRRFWLRDLKELDLNRAQRIRDQLDAENGLLREYLS